MIPTRSGRRPLGAEIATTVPGTRRRGRATCRRDAVGAHVQFPGAGHPAVVEDDRHRLGLVRRVGLEELVGAERIATPSLARPVPTTRR